jgi:hypothetical protein
VTHLSRVMSEFEGSGVLVRRRIAQQYSGHEFESIDFEEDWGFNFAQLTAWAYLFIPPFRRTGSMSREFLFPGIPLCEEVCIPGLHFSL